jgi:ubiquinone/menaquinone biosynthesis C-methylase UbiE
MNFLRRLSFHLWYLRHPPWDSGIVAPEVVDYIRTHQPGRALDLGCGSGTSSLALAKAGWCVTGVDFVPRAIQIAKRKTKNVNASVDFLVADVIRLPHSLFANSYDLVLDIGCFHSLSAEQKQKYLDNLETLLTPGGNWLMYGFFKETRLPKFSKLRESGGSGLLPADIERAQQRLTLVERQDGMDKKARPSTWFWFEKISLRSPV